MSARMLTLNPDAGTGNLTPDHAGIDSACRWGKNENAGASVGAAQVLTE